MEQTEYAHYELR